MSDLPSRSYGIGTSALQGQVTSLLLLALAYRHGQVAFDIPPLRGELLALISIMLWTACGVARHGRCQSDAASRIEWCMGGAIVGLLLVPHVPALATVVGVGCATLAVILVAMDLAQAVRALRIVATRRPALILAGAALAGFAPGGAWDWLGLVFLVLAAALLAWQTGRHLWLWSEGRTGVR